MFLPVPHHPVITHSSLSTRAKRSIETSWRTSLPRVWEASPLCSLPLPGQVLYVLTHPHHEQIDRGSSTPDRSPLTLAFSALQRGRCLCCFLDQLCAPLQRGRQLLNLGFQPGNPVPRKQVHAGRLASAAPVPAGAQASAGVWRLVSQEAAKDATDEALRGQPSRGSGRSCHQ